MANVEKLKKNYDTIVQKHSPKNALLQNCLRAFLVGGAICTLGQALTNFYQYIGLEKIEAGTLTTVTLIFLSAFLTAFNIYDNIGKFGGAGSVIPITGFANSMVSSAMEYKKEGYVYGLGAKLFLVAGPVIVFGVLSGVIVGIIYYFI